MKILNLTITFVLSSLYLNGQAIIKTYNSGDIPTSYSTTAYDPACTGDNTSMTITLPPLGMHTVTGIITTYQFEAIGSGWRSDQRSQIHCQNTSLTEAVFSGFADSSGAQYYNRSNGVIANGTYPSSTNLTFEMRAWRVFEIIAGCNTATNNINDGTWSITVNYTTCLDCDGDGFEVPLDCNDSDPNIKPNEPEVCDGIDNDCDGLIDDDDTDLQPGLFGQSCFPDNDGDGYGGGTTIGFFCICPTGTYPDYEFGSYIYDCDDTNENIYPMNSEICNGIDDNCSGIIDDTVDNDSDGYYDCDDCNDSNPDTNPTSPEICDGFDNDCDGLIDDDDPNSNPGFYNLCYPDTDGDGYGGGASIGSFCNCPPGSYWAFDFGDYVYDCDDDNADVHPNGIEVCNGLDNNCNEIIDDTVDNDGDGYYDCDDCDDANPNIFPSSTELCDGIDNDCDGLIDDDDPGVSLGFQNLCYPDNDSDGYGGGASIGSYCNCPPGSFWAYEFGNYVYDCDDDNPDVHPNALEVCNSIDDDCDGLIDEDLSGIPEISCNGIDEDCNGSDLVVDIDGDGFTCDVDCDDSDPLINPDTPENFSNDIDDNCDGLINEIACYFDADGDGFGAGSSTIETVLCATIGKVDNDLDCNDSDVLINPDASEICGSGIDENCDGTQDDVDADSDGYTCDVDCDDTQYYINPGVQELCYNGVDDNCNGIINELVPGNINVVNCYQDLDDDGYGAGPDSLFCSFCPSGWSYFDTDCDDAEPLSYPGNAEVCSDGIDNNCDGEIDELIDADDDGYTCDVDCDDTEPDVYPGAPEIEGNQIDDNCNGLIDEGVMDSDGDGIFDDTDNCIMLPNVQQSDIDGDGIGDLCDSDFITASNIGIGNSDPQTKFHLSDGELFIDKENGGIILRVDDSNCWRISVDTLGTVLTTRVDCP
jgi:hypothetical protein